MQMMILRKPRLRLYRAAVGLGLATLLIISCAQAQSSPTIHGNIDEVSTSLGRTAPHNSSFASVPDEFSRAPVGLGYKLGMTVYGEPQMSAELQVDENGNVLVPFTGSVHVAGKTLLQAANSIENALISANILKHPQVALLVVQYSTIGVNVLGEVQNPGRFQISGPKDLAEILALAGGETTNAGNVIEIQHEGEKPILQHYTQEENASDLRSIEVRSKDTIIVRRSGVVYVLGAVGRPGGYLMVDRGELNVLQAVSLAQGSTIFASLGKMFILREFERGQYRQIQVDFKKMSRGKAPLAAMRANDVLYVPTSLTKSVLVNGASLIGTAATAAIYRVP